MGTTSIQESEEHSEPEEPQDSHFDETPTVIATGNEPDHPSQVMLG